MKTSRILPHLIFWVAYLLWQVYSEYMTGPSSDDSLTLFQKWRWSFIVEGLLLPPKIIASYLCLYLIRSHYLGEQKRPRQWQAIVLVIAVLIGAVLAHRAVSNYIAYPIVLERPVRIEYWDLSFHVNSVIDSLFVVGIFVGLSFVRLQTEVAQAQVQLQREKLESELHSLKSQINPHFLFNTLNNIYSLARKKSDLTPDAIMKLSQLMRYLLYDGTKDRVTIQNEIELLEHYISLEKMRYPAHRLSLTFTHQVDDPRALIAPLILITFVENAFKHGAAENEEHSTIAIHLTLKENKILFNVTNSVFEHKQNGRKIGLANAERQLAILYREYSLQVVPSPHSYHTQLTINLNSYGPGEVLNR
jgi:two-component system, LytTR family, sensor kinase